MEALIACELFGQAKQSALDTLDLNEANEFINKILPLKFIAAAATITKADDLFNPVDNIHLRINRLVRIPPHLSGDHIYKSNGRMYRFSPD